MEKIKRVFRWISVLPGAIIALVLSYAFTKLALSIQLWFVGSEMNPDAPFMKILEIVISGVSGFCFIYFGLVIAPSHRKIVSYTLAGILIFFGGVMLLFNLQQREYLSVLSSISTSIGGMIALYQANQGELDIDMEANSQISEN